MLVLDFEATKSHPSLVLVPSLAMAKKAMKKAAAAPKAMKKAMKAKK